MSAVLCVARSRFISHTPYNARSLFALWLNEYALYLRTTAMTLVRVSVHSRAQLSAAIDALAASRSGFHLRSPLGTVPEGARLLVEEMVAVPSGWGSDAVLVDEVGQI